MNLKITLNDNSTFRTVDTFLIRSGVANMGMASKFKGEDFL